MNGHPASRPTEWRGRGIGEGARLGTADRSRASQYATGTASRYATWLARMVRRIGQSLRPQPTTEFDLYAYARSVESEMPNLASELRSIALRRP